MIGTYRLHWIDGQRVPVVVDSFGAPGHRGVLSVTDHRLEIAAGGTWAELAHLDVDGAHGTAREVVAQCGQWELASDGIAVTLLLTDRLNEPVAIAYQGILDGADLVLIRKSADETRPTPMYTFTRHSWLGHLTLDASRALAVIGRRWSLPPSRPVAGLHAQH